MLSISERVTALENTMKSVQTQISAFAASVQNVEDNTAEILGVLTFSRSTYGYVKKYAPRLLTFGAGIMSAAGFLNPEVSGFISSFFS